MTDAISRSAVMRSLEEAEQRVLHDGEWPYTASVFVKVIVKVKELVADLPAIDAVPVVRCKDCKSFMPYTESHRKASGFDGACAILAGFIDCDKECVYEMDFCSQGTRMDGETHD